MKKGKIWALAALCASVVLSAGTAAACNKHTHEYGDWTFTTAPTEDAEGTAAHTCVDGDHTEEITVAKLTDTSVWTLTTVDATHDNAGKKSYTSEYGTVEIAIPKGEHTYDGAEWKITAAPTMDAAGKAERKCTANDSGVESVDVPALTNEIWTADVKSAPTHTNEGLTVYTSVYGSVNYITAKLAAHEYGAWRIEEKPTLENGGKAVRYCVAEDEAFEEKVLPALSDAEFWSYSVVTPASHVANGKGEYTSDYGKVEVEIPAEPHTYDGAAWTITTKPTLTAGGKAERECTANDGGVDRVDIPALNNADVWTRDEATYVAPTDNTPGRATYDSVYGSVTVVLARLKEPYFNKTYYNFAYSSGADYKDIALRAIVSWDAASLPIDGKGEGTGSAYPYSGDVTITTTNFDTNEIEFTRDGSKYVGYADLETGVLVIFDATYIYVLTPYSYDEEYSSKDEDTGETTTKTVTHAVSNAKASAWTFTNAGGIASSAMAISYNYAEDKVLNIYIDEAGAVHFNVTFTDMNGKAVEADECYIGANYLYVKDADGELIASFGNAFNDGMHVLDGLEGVRYTCEGKDSVQLSGYGHIIFGNNEGITTATGNYTIVDGKLHAYVGNGWNFENFDRFYIITLDTENKTYTAEIPKVILKLNYGEYSEENVLDWNINMYIPFTLPTPTATDETKIFTGWYTDAACENAVELDKDGKYIPAGNATLYAGWAVKVNIFYVLEDGGSQTKLEYAVGDVLDTKLPELGIEVDENRYFAGWFFENGTPVTTNAELAEGDNNLVVYAKWNEIPAYYGEYEGKQMLSGDVVLYEATLTIDINGNMTGVANHGHYTVSLNGKVMGYSAASQELSWQPENGSATYTLWLDAESGLMVIPADISENVMDTYPFVVSKNDAIGANKAFGFYNGVNSGPTRTKLFAYGDKLALIYSNKIYSDVTVSDAFGNALSLDTVMDSKTLVVKKGDNTVVAFGTTASAFSSSRDEFGNYGELKLLDAHHGIYSAGNENYSLDGLGNISWTVGGDVHTGIYSYAETKDGYDVFHVYERERKVDTSTSTDDEGDEVTTTTISYKNVVYYELKLSKSGGAHVWNKPMVTISFAVADGSNTDANIPAIDAIEVNKNIAIGLETPANTSDSIFWGWYSDANHVNAVDLENYMPTADATLYAWWRGKVTVTVKYNDGTSADGAVDVLPGSAATVEKPAYTGHRFIGWYTDAACTDGNEWTSGETVVNDSIDIYAKWGDPHVLYGSYKGFEFYSKSTNGTMSQGNYKLEIDEYGYITNSRGTSYSGEPVDLDEENGGAFKVGGKHAYYDKISGVISLAWSNATQFSNDALIYTTKPLKTIEYSVYLNSTDSSTLGSGRLMIFNYEDETTELFYADNDKVCSGITVEAVDMSGSAVTDINLSNFTKDNILYFTVKDSTGEVIVKIGNSLTNFIPNDGTEGIYTCADKDNLILGGAGAFVWGGKSGDYTAVDGAENTYVLNVKASGKVVESYKAVISDGTYTATENKVTVNYVSAYSTHESVEVWANVALTLPAPEFEGYHLVGWYIEGAEDIVYDTEYAPSANVTLTAKWVAPHALMGTYKGFEFDSTSLSSTVLTFKVDVLGNVTAGGGYSTSQFTGLINEYDEASGTFKVGTANRYFYYDSASGTIVTTYSGSSSALTNDLYVYTKASSVSIASDNTYISWDSNKTKLAKLNVDGTDKYFFVYNNKVYGDAKVSVVDSENNPVTAMSAFKTAGNMITVNDCNNNLVGKFFYDGTSFIFNDGTGGTYTGALGDVVSDGYGNLTINGNTVNYAIVDGNLHFVADNAMRVISLGDGAYTQVQDGYAGTYTLPEGAGTVALDGLGGAGDNATYVVEGNNITIYVNGEGTAYGLGDDYTLLGKSVFAGLTFTKDSVNSVTFEDITEIKGRMLCGYSSWYVDFTGVLSGNILTLTVTGQVGTGSPVGGEIEFTITGDTMEITKLFGNTSGTMSSFNDTAVGYKYTCAGFSL